MCKNREGFTLLELIVVVAVVGILATLITPRIIEKIQDGKQLGTMQDMRTIAKACLEYAAINDEAPAAGIQNGPLSTGNEFITTITERQLAICPVNDKWGNPYIIYTGVAVASFSGMDAGKIGKGDCLIISRGRDGIEDGFVYDPKDPQKGMYRVSDKADYKNDLINWNGNFIRAPRSGKSESSGTK